MPQIQLQPRLISAILIIGFILTSCSNGDDTTIKTPSLPVRQDVLATFLVAIPEPLLAGTQIALEWVDPIAVHELAPERLIMDPVDDLHFKVDVPVKKGAFLQYRYTRIGNNKAIETGSDGKPVYARFYSVSNHVRIEDAILGFDASSSRVATGWINGSISIQANRFPASDILINIAGISAVSSIDGTFQIKKIPVGIQNITIFSRDGLFEPVQQQAVIEENTMTPINVELVPRQMVNVSFLVRVPANTPPNAELRIFGSLDTMGNSFAGLFGGTNPVQTQAPLLIRQSEDQYLLVLSLPADTEIKYLYSLGDTFWNKELDKNNDNVLRTFYIPRQDVLIEDQIVNWESPNKQPVTFRFIPPQETENSEMIQIQFNAFGWMEPMQMWPVGDGSYEFTVFSPLNFSDKLNYRFCRSLICGTLDEDSNTESVTSFLATTEPQVFTSTNVKWSNIQVFTDPTVVSTETIDLNSDQYFSAIEFTDSFRAAWMPYYSPALDVMKGLNANSVIIPYSWTFQSENPAWLTPNLARNPTIKDMQQIAILASEKGFKVYLHPTIQFSTSADDFWNTFGETKPDWETWFESISHFYQQTSLLAQQIQADGLIIGDEQLSPVMVESDALISLAGNYQTDSIDSWNGIFEKLRETSQVPLYLALKFDDLAKLQTLDFTSIDGLYLLDLGRISVEPAEARQYAEIIGRNLDEIVLPLLAGTDLKVWVGLDFPSVSFPQNGCITYPGQCNSPEIFNFPAPQQPEIQISLPEQTNLYNAAIPEILRRDWISGISSRRFLVPGRYQDQSSSIRGKPAADVIWYWFSQLSGNPVE